ncbi:hypothetical protein Taro_054195 [Colocasia esculenta]|uniref:CCHC-type domain-containing protein n=1 Tax=Colocasia esculenta TaxID=4460 RepID=A0A843XPZ7_COLES|nr:hypothetical protein [Colocasia esculenta]
MTQTLAVHKYRDKTPSTTCLAHKEPGVPDSRGLHNFVTVVSTQSACVSTQSASGVDTVCLCVDTHCPSQNLIYSLIVLILAELGSFVVQRFVYYVLRSLCLSPGFLSVVALKEFGVVVLQVVCTSVSGSSVVRRWTCNKSGHMKAECPEAKKDKYKNHKKEFHKKKNKAMVATWSDEDQSSDSNEEFSSSEGNEICFMVGSSEEHVDMSFELFTIEDWQEAYGLHNFVTVVSTQSTFVSTQSASGVDTVCLRVDTHCPSQNLF